MLRNLRRLGCLAVVTILAGCPSQNGSGGQVVPVKIFAELNDLTIQVKADNTSANSCKLENADLTLAYDDDKKQTSFGVQGAGSTTKHASEYLHFSAIVVAADRTTRTTYTLSSGKLPSAVAATKVTPATALPTSSSVTFVATCDKNASADVGQPVTPQTLRALVPVKIFAITVGPLSVNNSAATCTLGSGNSDLTYDTGQLSYSFTGTATDANTSSALYLHAITQMTDFGGHTSAYTVTSGLLSTSTSNFNVGFSISPSTQPTASSVQVSVTCDNTAPAPAVSSEPSASPT